MYNIEKIGDKMKQIIITNRVQEKKQYIKKIRSESPFKNVKIFSYKEFIENYPYQYDNKALEYIMDSKGVILEIAKIYLENIIKYEVENIEDEKCIFLNQLKQELIKEKKIKKNSILEKYLLQSEITLYHIKETKHLKQLLNKFNTKFINQEKKNYLPKVYQLETLEEEIAFVGEQIIKRIKEKIPVDNIFLANIKEEYRIPLKRIFKMMHIPVTLKNTTTLNQTTLGVTFIKHIEDLAVGIETIKSQVKTEKDERIYNQILDIVNSHLLEKHQKDFILYDLKHTTVREKPVSGCIKEIDLKSEEIKDEDYVFFLSFTKDAIPKLKKDEDYLKDKTKELLKVDTSMDLNKIEKEEIIERIQNIKNCTITLKERNGSTDCLPSELLEKMNLKIEKGFLEYNVSHKYNNFILGGLLDKYMKYKTTSETLYKLNKMYEIPYRTYKNNFIKIPKEKIWEKLKNELHISYTHLDTYNKCAFSYYIKNILHLDLFEETFQIKIGNIFHKVLEDTDYEDFDFEQSFERAKQEYLSLIHI